MFDGPISYKWEISHYQVGISGISLRVDELVVLFFFSTPGNDHWEFNPGHIVSHRLIIHWGWSKQPPVMFISHSYLAWLIRIDKYWNIPHWRKYLWADKLNWQTSQISTLYYLFGWVDTTNPSMDDFCQRSKSPAQRLLNWRSASTGVLPTSGKWNKNRRPTNKTEETLSIGIPCFCHVRFRLWFPAVRIDISQWRWSGATCGSGSSQRWEVRSPVGMVFWAVVSGSFTGDTAFPHTGCCYTRLPSLHIKSTLNLHQIYIIFACSAHAHLDTLRI